MTTPLVEDLLFDGMTEYGDNLLLGTEKEEERGNPHTMNSLQNLKSITGTPPDKSTPIPMYNYTKVVKRH